MRPSSFHFRRPHRVTTDSTSRRSRPTRLFRQILLDPIWRLLHSTTASTDRPRRRPAKRPRPQRVSRPTRSLRPDAADDREPGPSPRGNGERRSVGELLPTTFLVRPYHDGYVELRLGTEEIVASTEDARAMAEMLLRASGTAVRSIASPEDRSGVAQPASGVIRADGSRSALEIGVVGEAGGHRRVR